MKFTGSHFLKPEYTHRYTDLCFQCCTQGLFCYNVPIIGFLERWRSGLSRSLGKRVGETLRRFESCPLRKFEKPTYPGRFFVSINPPSITATPSVKTVVAPETNVGTHLTDFFFIHENSYCDKSRWFSHISDLSVAMNSLIMP